MAKEKNFALSVEQKERILEFTEDTHNTVTKIIDESIFVLSNCKAIKMVLRGTKEKELDEE